MKMLLKISLLFLLALPLTAFQGKPSQGNRSEIYLKASDRMLANGYPEKALQYLGRAIELDPASTKGYLKRGFLYLQRGEGDLALKDFTRIIELAPKEPNGYLTRGMLYNQRGDKGSAAADFRKGCDLGDTDCCTFLKEMGTAK